MMQADPSMTGPNTTGRAPRRSDDEARRSDDEARRAFAFRAIGSTVGLVGGTVFVLANRAQLPAPLPTVALVAWAPLLVLAIWAVYLRRPRGRARGGAMDVTRPHRRAGLIYLLACAAMFAVIAAGRAVLEPAGFAQALPALVAAAVGLHFIPFATAFGVRFFTLLGLTLAAIGSIGLLLGLTWSITAAPAAAVLAGATMIALIAANALRY